MCISKEGMIEAHRHLQENRAVNKALDEVIAKVQSRKDRASNVNARLIYSAIIRDVEALKRKWV